MCKINNEKLKKRSNGLEMYFNKNISKLFAELEQNDKNWRVAEIVDRVIAFEIKDFKNPLFVCELGGGAHPDRYHVLFHRLLQEPMGKIDWVDISPYMMELALKYIDNDKYIERKKVIRFIIDDILEYLNNLDDNSLDLGIMKYTLDYIDNPERLFELLSKKLKMGGKLVSTMTVLTPELKSISTNARFLYNGKEFPENETRILKDGDHFTIQFFKESGHPEKGYLDGAKTVKYYFSMDTYEKLASKYGLKIQFGDWHTLIPIEEQGGEMMNQDIMILTKE